MTKREAGIRYVAAPVSSLLGLDTELYIANLSSEAASSLE